MRKLTLVSLIFLLLLLGGFPLPGPQGLPSAPGLPLSQALQFISTLMNPSPAGAATAGSCVQTKARVTVDSDIKVVTFTCTASPDNGAFPAIAFEATTLAYVKGYYLYQVVTDPGSTAPTDNWDYTITDANGLDVLGGTGANRHTTTTQMNFPLIVAGFYCTPPVVDLWTLNITGNSVNSATFIFKLIFVRSR